MHISVSRATNMNSFIFTCFGLLCLVHFGQSAVSFLPDARDPDHPGKCVSKFGTDNIIINPGETITERESCTRISCSQDFTMDFASCGSIGHEPNCHLSQIDTTKDYPDCCPNIVCPDSDN